MSGYSRQQKRSHLRYVLPLTALLTAALPLHAADDASAIAGIYVGEVFNGGDMDAVTTTFSFNAGGRLTGEYRVEEESGVYSGRLSNFTFEGPRTMTMEWTDKFGEGFATMEFTRDYSGFTGAWGTQDSESTMPWNGKKQSQ